MVAGGASVVKPGTEREEAGTEITGTETDADGDGTGVGVRVTV